MRRPAPVRLSRLARRSRARHSRLLPTYLPLALMQFPPLPTACRPAAVRPRHLLMPQRPTTLRLAPLLLQSLVACKPVGRRPRHPMSCAAHKETGEEDDVEDGQRQSSLLAASWLRSPLSRRGPLGWLLTRHVFCCPAALPNWRGPGRVSAQQAGEARPATSNIALVEARSLRAAAARCARRARVAGWLRVRTARASGSWPSGAAGAAARERLDINLDAGHHLPTGQ
jgi:hypothetical protein